jgi:hypothetical protein
MSDRSGTLPAEWKKQLEEQVKAMKQQQVYKTLYPTKLDKTRASTLTSENSSDDSDSTIDYNTDAQKSSITPNGLFPKVAEKENNEDKENIKNRRNRGNSSLKK